MTKAKKTASLSEWADKFGELISQAENDGVSIEATSCCCGEGVLLTREGEGEEWVL